MSEITKGDLKRLIYHTEPFSVSIYMPSHRSGPLRQQDPIRLKNLCRQAARQLIAAGLRPPLAQARMAPIAATLSDSDFWRHQSDGLAGFIGCDTADLFAVSIEVPQLVIISDRFHVKPLLPILSQEVEFYILAVSCNSVRLYWVLADDIQLLQIEGAPSSFAETMRFDVTERQVQVHTGMSGPSPSGLRSAIYHGQGVGTDETIVKKRLLEYCQTINTAVRRRLGSARAPLVLAATEPLISIYRQGNTYPNLESRFLKGNHDHTAPDELRTLGSQLLSDQFNADQDRAIDRYQQFAASGQGSSELERILFASYNRQVDTLFVSLAAQRWGRFDPGSGTAEVHDTYRRGDQDLLNLAAVWSYQSGARVYALGPESMPSEAPVAATFRYVA